MLRIGAPIAISDQTIVAELVFIGSRLAFHDRDSRKTERQFEQGGFEDALWANKRDASAFEVEAFFENRTGKSITVEFLLIFEEGEGSESGLSVDGGHDRCNFYQDEARSGSVQIAERVLTVVRDLRVSGRQNFPIPFKITPGLQRKIGGIKSACSYETRGHRL